jgi:Leucine-rich repeat (LRR) protein
MYFLYPTVLYIIKVAGNLRNLDLSVNKIRVLPPTIGTFKVLKTLNLSRNSLAQIPPEFQARLSARF